MIKRLTLVLAALGMGLILTSAGARANPAPSREREETSREQTVRRIHSLLDNQVARDRLAAMGVDRQDLEKRLDRLSDQDLQELSRRLDSVGVGADGLGVVIALLVIAALVLLIIFLVERT
ncbi:MAG TPA: PA2779 family protein [Planctomycetota bacterium]|nr:PA2779 family protein [Planctomycetota bacterium]